MGVEAPTWRAARRAHTGRMQPTSTGARTDVSAGRLAVLFRSGSLGYNRGLHRGPRALPITQDCSVKPLYLFLLAAALVPAAACRKSPAPVATTTPAPG